MNHGSLAAISAGMSMSLGGFPELVVQVDVVVGHDADGTRLVDIALVIDGEARKALTAARPYASSNGVRVSSAGGASSPSFLPGASPSRPTSSASSYLVSSALGLPS